jgi:poly-gamma-glutamate synthase PgsB/CapB
MAVNPSLQEVNQTKLIQSTIGVLCNVREDHLEEMGPRIDDVARSLSRAMPVGGVCVTAERERLPILRREAKKRRCRLIEVDPEQVSDRDLAGFGWITFKENVAVALAVAELLGIDRRAALRGMWQAPPDPGALTVEEYRVAGRRLRFANVFAANDPGSTLQNVRMLQAQGAIRPPVHLVINCRPDRIERNGQMGGLVPAIRPARVFLIGEPTRSARATIPDQWQDRVVDLGGRRSGDELLAGLLRGPSRFMSVVAVGNIHGQGEQLLAALARLEPVVPAAPPPARTATEPRIPAPRSPVPVRGRSRDRW